MKKTRSKKSRDTVPLSSQKYKVGIWDSEKTYSGSRGQNGNRSRIRIRNTVCRSLYISNKDFHAIILLHATTKNPRNGDLVLTQRWALPIEIRYSDSYLTEYRVTAIGIWD